MRLTVLSVALFATSITSISLAVAADSSEAITLNDHHVPLDRSTSNSSSPLAKRGYSRLMDQCTGPNMQNLGGPYTVYFQSYCQPHISSTAVDVMCQPPHNNLIVAISYQFCAAHEICIDRIYPHGMTRAFCVSLQNFVEVAEGQLAELGHRIPRNGVSSKPVAAEALLVEKVGGASMRARKMELVAYGRHAIRGHASILRQLHNGRASCEDCYDVKLEPLPPGTAEVRVKALAEGMGKGYLYLATLS